MKRIPLVVLILCSCGVKHIDAYVEKHREIELPPGAENLGPTSSGSLWRDGRPTSQLFTDARALHEQDLVVVKVEEVANAQRSADTSLGRNSQLSATAEASVNAYLAALAKLKTTPDGSVSLTSNLASTFAATAESDRSESLTATVPAVVRKVLPNGNLFIEGHRVILVNSEEHHFYISGFVRPIDIDQTNTVASTVIADAQIEFTGRGDLSDAQHQGWGSRFFGWIWPF